MTPGARVAAAIGIIDTIRAGAPAEVALTRWSRGSRYAGSKDRAAVRDHVFDVLRCWRSCAATGGGETGRARMIGLLRQQGIPPDTVFTAEGHAPDCLTPEETAAGEDTQAFGIAHDMPDWLVPELERSLGDGLAQTADLLRTRAPVGLRVNAQRGGRKEAMAALADEGIETKPCDLAPTALTVVSGARRLRQSRAFVTGLVELQDPASQAVVDLLPAGRRCLDYCAGGGGKALALAAQPGRQVTAHDVNPRRMQDVPARAARAGAVIRQLDTNAVAEDAPYDIVLCDAPCSGSGAWRRSPDGKWSLSAERLSDLTEIQDEILTTAARLVAPGGTLAFATCSVLACENEDRVAAFLGSHSRWVCRVQKRFEVSDASDGFYTAHLTRE